jgi:hypothetical protein
MILDTSDERLILKIKIVKVLKVIAFGLLFAIIAYLTIKNTFDIGHLQVIGP